jgi:membrane protein implicated in regulation of membrane protease activity
MQRWDCIWLIVVVLSALAFSVWGLLYFTQLGHPAWPILVYAFFVLLFIYGRANRVRSRKTRKKDRAIDTKQPRPF